MVIKTLKIVGGKVYFNLACESCKKDVDEKDKFCRHCGRELKPLSRTSEVADIALILSAVYRGEPLPPKKESDEKRKELEKLIINAPFDSDDRDVDIGENECTITSQDSSGAMNQRCPRCKTKREGCEFLQVNGECRGVVYPTYPPQYPKCVFDKN